MTEAEWLAATNPGVMGAAVVRRKRASDRILRLFSVGFWDWQATRLRSKTDQRQLREAVAVLEEWAETGVQPPAARPLTHIFLTPSARDSFNRTLATSTNWNGKYGQKAAERAVWVLRELFGNPFFTRKRQSDPYRGLAFDPAWRTDTAVALAAQMYESREFSAMPILADALQDAGCTNEDMLNHCRTTGEDSLNGKGEHIRGCWVLDLVLEKS